MRESYIKAISYYLPEKIYSNEDLQKDFPEWSAEKVNKKIGISERHIAAECETAGDMAIKAAEKLFKNHEDIKKSDIDFVILCTQSPDFFLPTTACIIQDKLGLPTSCGAFDMNLGCSGYVYGLSLAKSMVVAENANNVLFLTAETYNKYIHERDKGNRSVFGDAAAATIVSYTGTWKIGNFSFGTDGSGAEKLIVKSGSSRHKKPLNDMKLNESGNPVSGDYLFMDGADIFNFTLNVVPELVRNTLVKNLITQDDIDFFIFHQANAYILEFLRKKVKIPEDKFYYCLEHTGNTVSCSLPIALYEAEEEGKINGKTLICGFGVGLSWAGTVIERVKK
jgi:3-oxoacyl-[acyl-carrier-protein] synthase III